ncbi:folylpolyglutamate synthase/dihydrofolate synthase family protein [Candidatus Parabeggiatoa sp. HSG14]|uniref:bifunctional folylpolyglutamate synthase/dihydrofolate synthase n=1 Tax=Candidatus Parabeggiatoa sp. HSG14 TaxID=3055593 RepID=UPI0025A85194|nr:folylpolyglutamate synthase/dihydrofolate synthase family protein [Thiotrichales bacterium HSG14]
MNNVLAQYNLLIKEIEELVGKVKFSPKVNLKLERIEHLLNLLGNPQNDFPLVHVGGTSGKGSTSTMISNILSGSGYKTGLYLSPYLQIINETCQINNKPVKTSDFLNTYSNIKPAIMEVAKNNQFGCPSYFEVKFAISLCLFRQHKIDVGVIEVGIGGTFDATNVIDAKVAVLVSVGLDHIEILGETIEEIAKNKAGIIKHNQYVISGFKQPSTQLIVKNQCDEKKATLFQLGKHIQCQYDILTGKATIKTPNNQYNDLQLNLVGHFQAENAACAIMAIELLKGFQCDIDIIRKSFQNTFIAGRLEIVQENPLVILDGAHNPEKFGKASRYITEKYADKSLVMILSIKAGRAINNELISKIAKTNVNHIIVTSFKTKGIWESLPAKELAQYLKEENPHLLIDIINSPINAVKFALEKFSKPHSLIWITGSLLLVGDTREYWYPSEKMLIELEQ